MSKTARISSPRSSLSCGTDMPGASWCGRCVTSGAGPPPRTNVPGGGGVPVPRGGAGVPAPGARPDTRTRPRRYAGNASECQWRGIDFDADPRTDRSPPPFRHPSFPSGGRTCPSRRSRTCTSTPSTRCWTVPRG
ncbi:hypothetical protein SAM23877_2152 [Streptomyces ambofaciens ATCC 23877]|uniref:Uncharacterized protein n=1 Tax=Streptomyces ambofaciens (strain ATCC 23877 / 3486 / DSM 40053 / JCM 4204 / NBRC 12836 / NRRL B-2516) TaxID=278992 RepID=A0A0K2AQL2_STRA7|nr:hypothetical protein SAM23877_2152 [Streptomyces ambofaciens ATCC 23877]